MVQELRVYLAVVLLVAAFGAGYKVRDYQAVEDELDSVTQLREAEKVQRERGDMLAAELEKEKQNIKTVTVETVKLVPKVTTVYVEKQGEAPKEIPDAVYTRGFIRVWNASLNGDSAKTASLIADDTAESDSLVRAQIESSDILDNAARNFGQYAECRAQLTKLINFVSGLK